MWHCVTSMRRAFTVRCSLALLVRVFPTAAQLLLLLLHRLPLPCVLRVAACGWRLAAAGCGASLPLHWLLRGMQQEQSMGMPGP